MKKFIRQLTIFSLIFIMTFGVGFSSQKGINVQAATTQTTTTNDGKLRFHQIYWMEKLEG